MTVRLQTIALLAMSLTLACCGRIGHLGKAPDFTSSQQNDEHVAMLWPGLPAQAQPQRLVDQASLWSGTRQSLLGDRRAIRRGDILTVVIEIDEKAEISNDTDRSRTSSESLQVSQLFGLPQRVQDSLPPGHPWRSANCLSPGLSGPQTSRDKTKSLMTRSRQRVCPMAAEAS